MLAANQQKDELSAEEPAVTFVRIQFEVVVCELSV